MAIYGTKELHKINALRTRYYTANYDICKSAVLETAKLFHYSVSNIDDQYNEILLVNRDHHLVVKISMITPRETAIDFHLQTHRLLDFKRGQKHLIQWYEALNKRLPFKGVSLHP